MHDGTRLTLLRSIAAAAAIAVLHIAPAAAGPKVYVGNFKDNTVSVIDSAGNNVVATVPVVAGPHGIGVSTDGRRVFVTGDASSGMSVIDTASDQVVRTVEVGKSPHGVALTPDGKSLLVGVYGDDRVALVDTSTLDVVATVPVPKPHTIAIRPDGKLAYVASQEPGKFALVVIDLAARTASGSIALDKPPRDLEFGEGGKLYFTRAGIDAIAVLDPATDRIVAEIPTGGSPHLANVFRGAKHGTAVVQGPGELLLFDPASNAPVKSIAVGKQPHWMASGDGRHVWVTNEGSNTVSVVDLETGRTATVAVGNAPRKVVVQSTDGARLVAIANFAFAPVEIVVAPATPVAWVNDDGAPHGIQFKDGAAGTDLLLPGAQFVRTFAKSGSYEYICSVHPYMTGRIVVR